MKGVFLFKKGIKIQKDEQEIAKYPVNQRGFSNAELLSAKKILIDEETKPAE